MKKIYVLALVAFGFATTANAQFQDDFETYTNGPMGTQNPTVWSVWSGTPSGPSTEDISVNDIYASSGIKSGLIGPGQGPQDALLLLGNKTSSDWTVSWNMYIPEGKTGYFNLQGETENGGAGAGGAGVFNSGNITFNADGATPGTVTDEANGDELSYPEDEWFPVSVYVNLEDSEYTLTVAGNEGTATPLGDDSVLGAIDFFAIDANNEYYIDEINFFQGSELSAADFNADVFTVYPNPVVNVLNISSKAAVDTVVVYDVLGKVVLSANPGVASPALDMSSLASGAYLVNVTIGDASKTIKVIK